MTSPDGPEDWGRVSQGDREGGASEIRTIQSKFLEVIRSAADAAYLELVVVYDAPNKGHGYIQKKNGFSNLYSFDFEFTNSAAIFVLEGEGGPDAQRREVAFTDGVGLDRLLAEVVTGINTAYKAAFPQLGALAPAQKDDATQPPANLSALTKTSPAAGSPEMAEQEKRTAAQVWGQTREGVRSIAHVGPYRPPGHLVRNVLIVALAVILLLFLPVLKVPGTPPSCTPEFCPGPTYDSVVFHFIGIGAQYQPPGWTSHYFIGHANLGNGTSATGLGLGYYYFAV